ncbi:MAG: TM2 domain-containing protein [Actinomycetaceae bacterium]|nr:TM2 domain-containing protein [Actinomycetaceae bacterium]
MSTEFPPPSGQERYDDRPGMTAGPAPQYHGQPGYQQPLPEVDPYAKSKLAAGLFGIFLGTFGVHNFYLGHMGKAVAQLLITLLSFGTLFWISSIWALVEAVLILTAAPGTKWAYDANGRPLRA